MERELCALTDIPDGGTRGIRLQPGARYADLVLARRGAQVYAYRNSCPHTGAPMERESGDDDFLDYQGLHIQCGIHAAIFRFEDGFCLWGPCARRRLEAVAVRIDDGRVIALDVRPWLRD
ncbi:MAG TPA: Rieske 2Fe-2S domain-containing protein [Plasticicumulans sp.]|uniref:Rieske (2Fe-2S) protein n=1 Tax=Plasticicumulans sp. TaxID=2307179 RepID=UPI002C1B4544|nr:Rieske 2Fe-2S domain-containing protein [Plasticicumulans sp.]HMV37977.1 Rieske 2Fe-2S domain-containing protein [Plasticicumulans sp.]HMW29489.1 Rieske 2Fe-2S domain-containing protein [Plasticicumulans sp.]HMW43483.1 Rieske 2Fe-2S domain-containing protein [Plasticicumulans sp.]HMX53028.1 Rieske 2Fe-2S domain-containing protein [Plasticicumulans sp.]HMZ09873.1 Rieske 2Fe-2S domain-containing protein [Plasticicumulans sp.]